MDRKNNKKEEFEDILESGSKVDEMFKDSRPPFGADPYGPVEVVVKPKPSAPVDTRREPTINALPTPPPATNSNELSHKIELPAKFRKPVVRESLKPGPPPPPPISKVVTPISPLPPPVAGKNSFTEIKPELQINANTTSTRDIFANSETIIISDPDQPIVGRLFENNISNVEKESYKQENEIEIDESASVINRKYLAADALMQLFNSDCSFGEMISMILKFAMEQISSDAGSFFEVDYNNQCYFFRAVTGKSSLSLLKVSIPFGSGIVGRVCETQRGEVMSKMQNAQIHLKSVGSMVGFHATDVMACPVVIRGKTFGCLELLNPRGKNTFSDSDFEILSYITQLASIVIENRLVKASLTKEIISLQNYLKNKAA